jgi:hypothetical protein
MAEYSIFTMCSKNYKDAYEFVINSWLKSSAKKIYIYTDDPGWKSKNDRVSIVNLFKETTDDWLTNTGRRAFVGKEAAASISGDLIFLDIDCFLVKDLGYMFDKYDFDFAVTRLFNMETDVSAGMYLFRNTEKNRKFFDLWIEHQNKNWKNGIGVKQYAGSYAQRAFSDVLRSYNKNGTHKVMNLEMDRYNRKVGKPHQTTSTIEALRSDAVEVLHFYARTWRSEEAKKILACLKPKVNCFDLGVHKGPEIELFVDMFNDLNITNYRIYGFEANKKMSKFLLKKFTDEKITIINKAISNKNSKARLYHDYAVGQGDSIFSTKNNVNKEDYEEVDGVLFSDWVFNNVLDFKSSFNIIRFNIEGAEWHLINDVVNSGMRKYIDIFCGAEIGADILKVSELKEKLPEYLKLLKQNDINIHPFFEKPGDISGIKSLISEGLKRWACV